MRASKDWLCQRGSALVLSLFLPGVWWLFNALNTQTYTQLRTHLSNPLILSLIGISFVFVLWHVRLGLEIILEDYTRNLKRRLLLICVDTLLLIMLACFLYAAALLFLKGN
jgi:succinate dehydrogenase hydrophobic membrane anchor protein